MEWLEAENNLENESLGKRRFRFAVSSTLESCNWSKKYCIYIARE